MDLYASVGGGFKRFHVESVSGEVVQGEGAVIIDGDNKPFLIKDMVTSTDVVNIYVLTSGNEPRVLTFFRDLLSGGLRHRDTSPVVDRARRLAYNHADDDSLVVLSDKLVQIARAPPTAAPTPAPTPMPTTAWPTAAPTPKPTVAPLTSDQIGMYIGVAIGASVCVALCITLFCVRECNRNREQALLSDLEQGQEPE